MAQSNVRGLIGDVSFSMSAVIRMGKEHGVDHLLLRNLRGGRKLKAQNGDLSFPLVVGLQQAFHILFHISIHM